LKQAFEHLLQTRGDELRSYLRRLTRDEALADDVLQEVSLVALDASVDRSEIDDLMAWSKGVARRKFSRMRRSQSREISSESIYEIAESGCVDSERRALSRQLIDRALPRLRESSADLLLRRHILEENASEIGDRSGRSAAAVRMKLKRAISAARVALFGD
jgi:RNA polymerase sigma factor (sigma-70 family)